MKHIVAALLACLPLAALAAEERWNSILMAGGLSLGPPFHSPDGWLLVVRANLGALEVACKSTRAAVEGQNIYLTVISSLPASKVGAVCPAAKIGEIEPGSYKVFYRGPHEEPVLLKEVQFAR